MRGIGHQRFVITTVCVLSMVLAPGLGHTEGDTAEDSRKFTLPLPSADLANGTLTLKVVNKGLQDIKVGQTVELYQLTGKDLKKVNVVPTGEDGRARFDNLRADVTYVLAVPVEGNTLRSQPFPGPEAGGFRMLVTLGDGPVMGAPAPGMSPGNAAGVPPGHPPMTGGSLPSQQNSNTAPTIEPFESEEAQIRVVVQKGRQKVPQSGVELALTKKATTTGAANGLGTPLDVVTAKTDAAGQWVTVMGQGDDATFSIKIIFDEVTYQSAPFKRPEKGGLKITYTVYQRSSNRSGLVFGAGTHWRCQLGEGDLRFMHLIHLSNEGDDIFDPGPKGLSLSLPEGATDIEIPNELSQMLRWERQRNTIQVTERLFPGTTLPLRVLFTLAFEGPGLEFRQTIPLNMEKAVVAVLNSTQVQLEGPAITGHERVNNPKQKGMIFQLEPINAGSVLEFSFSNLPRQKRQLQGYVLLLAGLITLWGIFGALSGPRRVRARKTHREELLQKLLTLKQNELKGQPAPDKQRELRLQLRRVWEEPW